METIHISRQNLDKELDENVYEPSEDTFILLDALENDLQEIERNANVCLEFGCGSGVISVALSKALKNHPRLIFATDLNINACRLTKKCAIDHNQIENIEIINTNLAEPLLDRLANFVDLMVFNPPYVPTTDAEYTDSDKPITKAWAGGRDGLEITRVFVHQYLPTLLSWPKGVAYLVAIKQNRVTELANCLIDKHSIYGSVVLERKAGTEHLHVIKYNYIEK